MPKKRRRILMRKVKEILRLHYEQGLSKRAIARACNISPSTVSEYLKRAMEKKKKSLGEKNSRKSISMNYG